MVFRPLKHILLAVALVAAPHELAAQTASESAIARARVAAALRDSLLRLNSNLVAATQNNTQLARFLKDPFDPQAVPPTLDQLDAALANANERLRRPAAGRDSAGSQAPFVKGILPGLGGFEQAAGALGIPAEAQLIAGLTDFMVTRAKDEVAFSFLLHLRDQARADPWLRKAMPRSYQLMQRIDVDTYQTLLPVLRSAYVEDLNGMPARATELTGLDADYLRGLEIAYERGMEIRRGSPPAIALANLARLSHAQMPDASSRRALQMVGLIAREYAASGGEPFVNEVTRSDRGWLRRYLVGFLAHDLVREDEISDAAARAELLQFLATRETDAVALVNQLDAMRRVVEDVRERVDSLARNGRDSQEKLDRLLATSGAVLQVMNTGQRFLYWKGSAVPAQVQTFRRFVADANTLNQAFIKRDYGTLVSWVLEQPALDPCAAAPPAYGVQADSLRRAVAGERGGGDSRRIERVARERFSAAAESVRVLCGNRAKYLSFAASLAAAQSAEQVNVVLRNASAPVGAFRAKRNQFEPDDHLDRPGALDPRRWGPGSVSVVGYLGVTGGLEGAGEFPFSHEDAGHLGVALPVGVEVSAGFPFGAVSLFAPILDLGTLASARLGGGEAEVADPTLRQVLAPGLFAVWNISRAVPLSLGVGAQVVPGLRESDGKRVDAVRASTFLGVDATLFHFRF